MSDIIISNESKPRFVRQYILGRVKKNKNFLAAFVGQTGSGKSLGAISVAEAIDPGFNESRIVFNPVDFMKLIRQGSEEGESILPPGSVIVFDETTVSMDSKNWYSQYNKMMNYVLQTFRYRCIIVFFTFPDLSFLDASARKLLHAVFEFSPTCVNYRKNFSKPKIKLVDTKPHFTKKNFVLTKFPRGFHIPSGKTYRIKHVVLPKPSKPILKAYEKKKGAFAEELYKEVIDSFSAAKSHDPDKTVTSKQPLTKREREIYEYALKKVSVPEVSRLLGIATSTISSCRKRIRGKGYEVPDLRER